MMLSRQEVFERVTTHMLTQNEKAQMPWPDRNATLHGAMKLTSKRCVLRTLDGKKCAVGCLIADAEYLPALETEGSVSDIVHNLEQDEEGVESEREFMLPMALYNSGVDWFNSEMVNMLIDLQDIHDGKEVHSWFWSLEKLGNELSLDVSFMAPWSTEEHNSAQQ